MYLKCALERGREVSSLSKGNLDDDALGLAYLQLATEAAARCNGPQTKSDRAVFELIEYGTMSRKWSGELKLLLFILIILVWQ